MKTLKTVANATTLLASGIVGLSAISAISTSFKSKSKAGVAIGGLTLLICYAAFQHSLEKLKEE